MYTVQQIVERMGVTEHTVLAWIHTGELRAVNVGRAPGAGKPRWRISAEALAQFELGRETTAPPAKTRRRKQSADVIQFYA